MWETLLFRLEFLGNWIYWIVLLAALLEATAFIGLVFPGTTLITFVGYLASRDVLDIGDAISCVAIGGIVGDTISYYLGLHGKNYFKPESKLFKPELLEKGRAFFASHGAKGVFLARFIGPLRPIVPFVAGLSHMNPRRFFVFNILGGIAAAVFYVLIGYYFGFAWHAYRHVIRRIEPFILLAVIAGVTGYIWRKRLFNKS